jgi:glycine/D-amino acid oxidase-like deaminating enzyme/nitrite reductase/ring-hydroxylating ferredoxin subunit
MRSDAGSSTSLWMAAADVAPPALEHDVETDVCVVGAGIAGLTTAFCLSRDGRSVTVVDDGPIGGGETSRTTAHLVNALDDYYHELEKLHGEDGARLAAHSHSAAIDAIERIVAESHIHCDFRRLDGYLFAAHEDDSKMLSDELHAARRAGLSVEQVEHVPVDFHDFGMALRFPHQAQLHPMKYLAGLAEILRNAGVHLYTGTHATQIEDGAPARVVTEGGPAIKAKAVVVATNSPMLNRFVIHTKQAAYRTYALAARLAKGAVPPILLWDTADPYHYVRTHEGNGAGHDWLIVGGEDHKTGQPEEDGSPHEALEAWVRERFPMAQDVAYRWSGQVMEPVDGLAFIGRNPGDDNVYIATGDSGNGMTHGTLAGLIISDLVAGRRNAWAGLYDPARKSVRAAGAFARENLNVAKQYADLVTSGEADTVSALESGYGRIIRRGTHKIAVYRDEQDVLHHFSAVCPHLGCIVGWNAAEKTWDCPCHGSRFDKTDGHVLNGPAKSGLEKMKDEG